MQRTMRISAAARSTTIADTMFATTATIRIALLTALLLLICRQSAAVTAESSVRRLSLFFSVIGTAVRAGRRVFALRSPAQTAAISLKMAISPATAVRSLSVRTARRNSMTLPLLTTGANGLVTVRSVTASTTLSAHRTRRISATTAVRSLKTTKQSKKDKQEKTLFFIFCGEDPL